MRKSKKSISTTEARRILKPHLYFGRIVYDFAARAEKPTTLVGCYIRDRFAKDYDAILKEVRDMGFDNKITMNAYGLVRIHGCRKVGR